jgi:hypothetical protein
MPPHNSSALVHGWVKTVKDALVLRGIEPPEPIDYPEELSNFLGRDVKKTTLREMHDRFVASELLPGGSTPVFVKPVEHKLFTGHTVERFSHLAETSDLPRDTSVWVSSVVDFVSEYRCFVHGGSLVDIRRYFGDAWTLPDKKTVIAMIRAYENAPAFYGLDVGVTRGGETLLVEVNDGWALGHYGMSPLAYTEGVVARWEEMTRDA